MQMDGDLGLHGKEAVSKVCVTFDCAHNAF